MKPNDIIEAYVTDVVRGVPRKDRNDIGLELRNLLTEMLADKANEEGKAADGATALDMLREFGVPADVAARYSEAGFSIIPANQTRAFTLLAFGGIALQWAISLPSVFQGQPIATWWFAGGLGALWWPGFLVMMSIIGAWADQKGWFEKTWNPRIIDPERIDRRMFAIGLGLLAIGAIAMASLPFLVDRLPDPQPRFFAFDPDFLATRAPFATILWLGQFVLLYMVFSQDRWSRLARRIDLAFDIAWIALLGWWLAGGKIFQMGTTDDVTKSSLGLVIVVIVLTLIMKIYRQLTRLRLPAIGS
jgi:hypothetical protein